jgi:hypothetical protein
MAHDGADVRYSRAIVRGSAAGAIATAAMSAILIGSKKLGFLGEMPPRKIVRSTRRRLGLRGVSTHRENVVSTVAHWAFGVGAGALLGAFHRKRVALSKAAALGAAYGVAIWAVSYRGWVPALGIMRHPGKDRPGRPTSMVVAHLVYGSTLGTLLDL